jgi:hypothetical protein
VWLIEVNTNPCIEESSGVLKMLLPRMIDDALKLSIDVLFPNPKEKGVGGRNEFENKIHGESNSNYPVDGYLDSENMWDKVFDMVSGRSYLSSNDRIIRADNIIYMPEGLDFYVTSFQSYKKHTKDIKYN